MSGTRPGKNQSGDSRTRQHNRGAGSGHDAPGPQKKAGAVRAAAPQKQKDAEDKNLPLHGSRIEDYAVIGDCESAALVSRKGSVDWLCWPTFSSDACFAGLLGTRDHGYFSIAPASSEKVLGEDWRYRPQTLIVEKTWRTENGEVLVSDFMPPRGKNSDVVRIVKGVRGTVAMRMELALRFDYGRTIPWVERVDHHMRAIAGPDLVVLRTEAPLHGEDLTTASDFEVNEGQSICFVLSYGSSLKPEPESFDAYDAYNDTVSFWTDWTSRCKYKGKYQEEVERSLITLKTLTYRPSGGVVAAVTTSLPEKIGGPRNWDYRFCWLRDTAFTLLVLLRAGYTEEAVAWRRWLLRAIAGSAEQLQPFYGICGERELVEWKAAWLPGYEHSKPVNIGNAAQSQLQIDIYGEVIAALARMPTGQDEEWRTSVAALAANMLDHLCEIWQEPDEGIWEVRGGPQQFVHSKVMAWVAFERGIRAHEMLGDTSNQEMEKRVRRWRRVRAAIHKEVCEKGFDEEQNSFVQAYGSKQLDASCLRIPLVGFLPANDPRVVGTVDAIGKRLMQDGLIMRYNTATAKDGLPPGEGAFLACSFWYVADLFLIGRKEEAHEMFERLLSLRNDLGLLSEEYNTKQKRQVGNFPQAFTHLTLVHAAMVLNGNEGPWGNHHSGSVV